MELGYHLSQQPDSGRAYYYLYLVEDIFSRMIVGWTVEQEQSAEHGARLIDRACQEHGIARGQLTLHADNGAPVKGATLLATLERLGIAPSFSRPRVSDDNPYSESLFKTLKYRPSYPESAFSGSLKPQSGSGALSSGTTPSTFTARSVLSRPAPDTKDGTKRFYKAQRRL